MKYRIIQLLILFSILSQLVPFHSPNTNNTIPVVVAEGITDYSTDCNYESDQPLLPNKPIDMIVFIDESQGASIDIPNENPPYLREQTLQLLTDFLYVDSQLRGVDNRISIWSYATITLERQEWHPITEDSSEFIKNLDRLIPDPNATVDFQPLFKEIKDQILSSRESSRPVVIIINDATPNGDDSDFSFAQESYTSWSQFLQDNPERDPLIYMLDFSLTANDSRRRDRLSAREAWRQDFFAELPHEGAFWTLDYHNKLQVMSMLWNNILGTTVYYPLPTYPSSFERMPLSDQTLIPIFFNRPSENRRSVDWNNSSADGSEQLADLWQSDYGFLFQSGNDILNWQLPVNTLEESVVYGVYSTDGLAQFRFLNSSPIPATGYARIRAQMSNIVGTTLTWESNDSSRLIVPTQNNMLQAGQTEWRIGPFNNIDTPTAYQLSLEKAGSGISYTCQFYVVPVSSLLITDSDIKIIDNEIEDVEVTITLERADLLLTQTSRPIVTIEQDGLSLGNLNATIDANSTTTTTHTFHATSLNSIDLSQIDINQPWQIVAQLNEETIYGHVILSKEQTIDTHIVTVPTMIIETVPPVSTRVYTPNPVPPPIIIDPDANQAAFEIFSVLIIALAILTFAMILLMVKNDSKPGEYWEGMILRLAHDSDAEIEHQRQDRFYWFFPFVTILSIIILSFGLRVPENQEVFVFLGFGLAGICLFAYGVFIGRQRTIVQWIGAIFSILTGLASIFLSYILRALSVEDELFNWWASSEQIVYECVFIGLFIIGIGFAIYGISKSVE